VRVSHNPSSGHTIFQVADNGTLVLNISTVLGSQYYDRSTAEFINERTSNPLTNYNIQEWTNARTRLDTGLVAALTHRPYYSEIMWNASTTGTSCSDNHVMAYPGVPNAADAFDSFWCRAS